MSSRLFQTVVVSSTLLLAQTGCGPVIVTADERVPSAHPEAADAARDDAPAEDAAVSDDAPTPPDVAPVEPDVAPADASAPTDASAEATCGNDPRLFERGWPTTKGVYCTTDDAGVTVCCRGVHEGLPTHCCVSNGVTCVTCVHDDAGVCVPVCAEVDR